ncbi:MAG: hypothetical protein P1U32_07585 [Legionellaceae bacterium]|nr:hypothetical protein [Legionellaceae bacterium]
MPKLKISPAQALLVLMDAYQDDTAQFDQLKQWYLSGFEPKFDENGHPQMNLPSAFEALLTDKALEKYDVSFDSSVINEDASRRFFETHLAYHTLEKGLDNLDSSRLERQMLTLKRALEDSVVVRYSGVLPLMRQVLDGDVDALAGEQGEDVLIFREYVNYIHSIDDTNGPFKAFTPEQREKVKMLAKCSFLGVMNASFLNLPIDVYGTGYYSDEQRGKKMKEGGASARSSHLGVMKSHMPLSKDDVAATEHTPDFLKPSDQSTFQSDTSWTEYNFAKAVHPFSNALSGTMLCQIRNIEKFQRNGTGGGFGRNSDELKGFSRLFISAMLFGSGGHTLHEYTKPLELPEVVSELSGQNMDTSMNLETVFRENNPGFDVALDEARRYNRMMLARTALHQELRGSVNLHDLEQKKSVIQLISDYIAALRAGVNSGVPKENSQSYKERFSMINFLVFLKEALTNNFFTKALKAIHEFIRSDNTAEKSHAVSSPEVSNTHALAHDLEEIVREQVKNDKDKGEQPPVSLGH